MNILKTVNWPPNIEMREAVKFIKDSECVKQEINQVRNLFEDFRKTINEKINSLEKEIIIKLEVAQEYDKKISAELNQKLHDAFSMDFLKSYLNKFANNCIDLESLNKELNNFSQTEGRQHQIIEINKSLNQHCKKDIQQFTYQFKEYQNLLQKMLNKIRTFDGLVRTKKLEFYKSNFSNSKDSIEILNTGIQFKVSQGTHSVVYSDKFSRNKFVSMTFKIHTDTFGSQCILFGVVKDGDHQDQHHYWNMSSGNQVCISDHENFSRKGVVSEGCQLKQIFRSGFNVKVDIEIKENLLEIYDEQRKSVIKSNHIF